MKYETLLFDLDGTLTDSAPGILNAVRHALRKVHAPIPDEATLTKFIGPPLIDSFERYCGFSHTAAVQALADYREYFTVRGLFENSVYAGIPELLDALAERGATALVATSKPEPFARRILDYFHLTDRFAAIHGATLDETRNRKADVIAWAIARSGNLGRVLMVGDRAQDVEGAHANNLPCLGVLWGYGSRTELAEADALVESPRQILAWLSETEMTSR